MKKAYYSLELSKCSNPQHEIAKRAQLDSIPNEAYYHIIVNLKTQFAPLIAHELSKSAKDLPEKMIELFDKVKAILNPESDD